MDLKIRVYCLLTALVAVYNVQAYKSCDWPVGRCQFYKDPCPHGTVRCPANDKGCKLKTNYCCCNKASVTTKPTPKPTTTSEPTTTPPEPTTTLPTTKPPHPYACDWPVGKCAYYLHPCPPNMIRCPHNDKGCGRPTHCCCYRFPPITTEPTTKPTPKPTTKPPKPSTKPPHPYGCDYPVGSCTYYKDPCPAGTIPCPGNDKGCKLKTNRCCCYHKTPPPTTTKPTPKPYGCDWPIGFCSYYKDPCPSGTIPCPGNDKGCKHKTNRCCCYHKTPPPTTTKPTPKPTTKPPHPPKNVCDWPVGTCTYKYDPCPPDWERCPQYDYGCKVKTNHCCCRKKTPPVTTKPTPKPKTTPPHPPKNVCDWPVGTCTYKYDPCPPDWERCPQYDYGCKLATNHCCCRKKLPPVTTVKPTTYPTTTPPQTTTTKPLCISPHGTCSYAYLPCPSNSVHCPHEDKGCYKSPLYKCCCKIPPPTTTKPTPKPTTQPPKPTTKPPPVCGGPLKASWGVIKSPNFPYKYPEYAVCRWITYVTRKEKLILQFKYFALAPCDFLLISDGDKILKITNGFKVSRCYGYGCYYDEPSPYDEFESDNVDDDFYYYDVEKLNEDDDGWKAFWVSKRRRLIIVRGGNRHVVIKFKSKGCGSAKGFSVRYDKKRSRGSSSDSDEEQ